MTIKQALQLYPGLETDLLLSHVLSKPKEFLYAHPEGKVSEPKLKKLKSLLKRRLDGEPIAYLLGYKWFFSQKFVVDKHVLVPRPSTELLVERALEIASRLQVRGSNAAGVSLKTINSNPVTILDMATGSGCIAVSIANEVRGSRLQFPVSITAADISKDALVVARKNAKLHKAKVQFVQSDLFSKIKGEFNIVIANLPYVPASEYKKLLEGLRYEPKVAITDNGNTFTMYKKFLEQARNHLVPGGTILMEMDPKTKPYITKWTKQYFPKAKLKFYKDLQKLWRYAVIHN